MDTQIYTQVNMCDQDVPEDYDLGFDEDMEELRQLVMTNNRRKSNDTANKVKKAKDQVRSFDIFQTHVFLKMVPADVVLIFDTLREYKGYLQTMEDIEQVLAMEDANTIVEVDSRVNQFERFAISRTTLIKELFEQLNDKRQRVNFQRTIALFSLLEVV